MKIAVLSFYSGHHNRGVETYVDQFASQLRDTHTVDIFQSGSASKSKASNIYVFPVHLPKVWPTDTMPPTHILKRLFLHYFKRKEFVFFLKTLPRLLKNNYDIIYPTNSGWPIPILRLITFFTKTKLVIAGHSGPGWDDYWHLLWHPDIFICFTKSQLNWSKKATLWRRQHFVHIPHAVDTKKFSPIGSRAELSLEKPIILCVAATTKDKRVTQTLRAIALLKKGSFLLLGSGPLDQEVNHLGHELLGKNRFLHLAVSHVDIPSYYRASDLFTFCPYPREAFGLVYLEALATNLPVVASDDSIRREIVGNAGIYVTDPDNAKIYTRVIKQALSKKWGNLPLKRSVFFSTESVYLKYKELFHSLTS